MIPPHTQNGFIDTQVCKYCFRSSFVFEPRNTNLSPISPEKHGAAAAAARNPSAVDIGFARSMSLHHQQAIAMAQLMLDGRPTPLAPLARQIAYAQLLELGEMRGFLKLWGAPLSQTKVDMSWMLAGDTAPDAELRQLPSVPVAGGIPNDWRMYISDVGLFGTTLSCPGCTCGTVGGRAYVPHNAMNA